MPHLFRALRPARVRTTALLRHSCTMDTSVEPISAEDVAAGEEAAMSEHDTMQPTAEAEQTLPLDAAAKKVFCPLPQIPPSEKSLA